MDTSSLQSPPPPSVTQTCVFCATPCERVSEVGWIKFCSPRPSPLSLSLPLSPPPSPLLTLFWWSNCVVIEAVDHSLFTYSNQCTSSSHLIYTFTIYCLLFCHPTCLVGQGSSG